MHLHPAAFWLYDTVAMGVIGGGGDLETSFIAAVEAGIVLPAAGGGGLAGRHTVLDILPRQQEPLDDGIFPDG